MYPSTFSDIVCVREREREGRKEREGEREGERETSNQEAGKTFD